MRTARSTGSPGTVFAIDEEAVALSKTHKGNGGPYAELRVGDRLMHLSNDGDCFSSYAVFRGGRKLSLKWQGYDGVGKRMGNVVRDIDILPGKYE